MTEQEWLHTVDTQQMLRYLHGKTSERKLRLFAVACCRHLWHLLTDHRSRHAIETVERYADGDAGVEDLRAARSAAMAAHHSQKRAASAVGAGSAALSESDREPYFMAWATAQASKAAWGTTRARPWTASRRGVVAAVIEANAFAEDPGRGAESQAREVMERTQVNIARDIFGNPFRPVEVSVDRLTHSILTLAQSIYEDRAFDRLPILADALEEAGFHDPQLLAHCRGPGPHARGCFVIDLILGK